MTAVYLFAVILGVLLVAVLVAPMIEGEAPRRRASDAGTRLAAALEALRELEFDHETGKIEDEDYRVLRTELAAEAIAARDAGARVRPEGGDAGATACPVCGAATPPEAKFCSRCGTAVAGEPTAPGGDAASPGSDAAARKGGAA